MGIHVCWLPAELPVSPRVSASPAALHPSIDSKFPRFCERSHDAVIERKVEYFLKMLSGFLSHFKTLEDSFNSGHQTAYFFMQKWKRARIHVARIPQRGIHSGASTLQVQSEERWTLCAHICHSLGHLVSLFPSETSDLQSLVFERTAVSLKRCFVTAALKDLLIQEVQRRQLCRESAFLSFHLFFFFRDKLVRRFCSAGFWVCCRCFF